MALIHLRLSQNHMATTFDFVLSLESSQEVFGHEVLTQCHRLVTQLESELSEFIADSPVARLNAAPVGHPVRLTESGFELLEQSFHLKELTQGSFDCTAKSPTEALGGLAWDSSQRCVWRTQAECHLGFGAIGKGYALDQVRTLVEQAGFQNYWLNAGGSSLILSGWAHPESPWRWGWSWQKDETGDPLGLVLQHDSGIPMAIGVSGLHEQGNHLLDPRQGTRATHAKSALVGEQRATYADALSTALFVAGWDEGRKNLASSELTPALGFIDETQVPWWNGTFQKLWGALAAILLILLPVASYADDAVDLGDLGMSDFTPYVFDRNSFWILLPVAALGLVFLHLKKVNPRPSEPSLPWEEKK
jgi:FAD:protein FMN transferase